MEQSELKIAELEAAIASPDNSSDYALLAQLCDELQSTKHDHDGYFAQWAEIAE